MVKYPWLTSHLPHKKNSFPMAFCNQEFPSAGLELQIFNCGAASSVANQIAAKHCSSCNHAMLKTMQHQQSSLVFISATRHNMHIRFCHWWWWWSWWWWWLVMTMMMSMMVGDDHHGSGPVGSVGLPLCQRPVRNTRQAKRKIRWWSSYSDIWWLSSYSDIWWWSSNSKMISKIVEVS